MENLPPPGFSMVVKSDIFMGTLATPPAQSYPPEIKANFAALLRDKLVIITPLLGVIERTISEIFQDDFMGHEFPWIPEPHPFPGYQPVKCS